jgi:hypothetical protein
MYIDIRTKVNTGYIIRSLYRKHYYGDDVSKAAVNTKQYVVYNVNDRSFYSFEVPVQKYLRTAK